MQIILPDDEVYINNSKIPSKSDLKYLKVTLNKKLTFSKYIKVSKLDLNPTARLFNGWSS